MMAKMVEAHNHLLICADDADPAQHSHMAAHIVISFGPELTALCGGKTYRCRGLMIPSGVAHRIDTHHEKALVFLFDSSTNVAVRITKVEVLPDAECEHICRLYAEFEGNPSSQTYLPVETYLLERLGLSAIHDCMTDERIREAVRMIRSRMPDSLTCREAAASVSLSPGRFSHLFRQQMGMTFAAYLIYQRLVYAYVRIMAGGTITEAALDAGFSSSAHFADVNRRVFGLSASRLTGKLTFVKVE